MIDKEKMNRLFSAAARDTSGEARLELFRALDGIKLHYVASPDGEESKGELSVRLQRMADGSSAFVVYTSRHHPDLPQRIVREEWSDVLKTAYESVRADWLVIANMRNETVAVSREQVALLISDLSRPQGQIPATAGANDELETIISLAAEISADDLYGSVLSLLTGRELYLHLTTDTSAGGRPSVVTSPAAGRDGWMLAYTTRGRPGLRYGGITWEALTDMVSQNTHMPGVRVVNAADDWILLSRDVVTAQSEIDASKAITIFLRHYPGKNDAAFDDFYGPLAPHAREVVRTILEEAMRVRPDCTKMSLNDAGDYVEAEMHSRHPNLSAEALECIGNYYTYLMR